MITPHALLLIRRSRYAIARQPLLTPILLVGLLAGSGCGGGDALHRPWQPPTAPTVEPRYTAAPASDGAIYRAGSGMTLFEDDKARYPGDLLTIVLSERTNASSRASTSTSKSSDTSLSVPLLAGRVPSLGGGNVFDTEIAAEREFDGDGSSDQSNQLTGSLTVTVVDRLANGNLIVQGEKRLQLNQGDELIRFQGIVRSADIGTDNRIDSSRVADARILYAGRGALASANAQGWLSRFFNSGWMPF